MRIFAYWEYTASLATGWTWARGDGAALSVQVLDLETFSCHLSQHACLCCCIILLFALLNSHRLFNLVV